MDDQEAMSMAFGIALAIAFIFLVLVGASQQGSVKENMLPGEPISEENRVNPYTQEALEEKKQRILANLDRSEQLLND